MLFFALLLPAVAGAAAAEGEAARQFDVLEYEIEGNTVLPVQTVERAVYRHLGPRKSIVDVERAREALERAYHEAGYSTVFIDIPEQSVDSGVVRLKVNEGRVDRLRVVGSRYYSLGEIRARAPSLAEGEVPYFPDVQRDLAQLNRAPDRRVTPVLKPAQIPGRVDVELKVDDEFPLHGSLELTNRKSGNTRDLRLGGAVRYDNLWQRQHSIGLNYQVSPQDQSQVEVFSANYLFPWPGSAHQIALYAVDSQSNVPISSGGVVGKGSIYGARAVLALPPPVAEGYLHSLTLGVDYKDFKQTQTLLGSDAFSIPIKYLPLTAQYNATLQDAAGSTQFGAAVNFAIREMFGLNRDADFAAKRFKAQANYAFLRLDIQRNQPLPRNWSLLARAETQLASGPLISNEQYSAGGVDSVRGYLESEVFGDDALRGRIELRTPSLFFGPDSGHDFTVQFFTEAAALRIKEPLAGNPERLYLSSAGVGLRAKARRHYIAAFDIAHPFRPGPFTPAGGVRANFRLAYEF
jgi:hemolysin activation/secretion protein